MTNKRIFTGLAAPVMAAALVMAPAVPVMAAAGNGTDYDEIAGTSTTFTKYFIMDEGDSVPTATFTFTITPGTAIAADVSNNAMEVMAGVGSPSISSVTFGPSDSTILAADVSGIDIQREYKAREKDAVDGSDADAVQLDAGEKYAKKDVTIDFSGIKFNEPGIYRYIITEEAISGHEAAGIIHDPDTDRVLDVYVTDNGDGTLAVGDPQNSTSALQITGYVLHTDVGNVALSAATNGSEDVADAGNALDDKTDGFTNEYVSKDLKVEKEVTGNQASRDKYFEFTVTATNVTDADSYVVSLADDNNDNTNDGSASATSGAAKTGGTIAANAGKTNPTVVTGAQLKAGQKFYLMHGQSIVIRGLAPNAGYTVTENAEDYASAVKSGDTNSGTIGTVAGENKMAVAGFTNTRDGVIPTGVLVTVIPGAAIVAGAAAAFAAKRKGRKEEDED